MTITATAPATPAVKIIEESWEEGATPRFNANHRCDRCGAQAYVEAVFTNGEKLLFCSHDANAQRPLMEAKSVLVKWYSETDRLIENRKQGSEN